MGHGCRQHRKPLSRIPLHHHARSYLKSGIFTLGTLKLVILMTPLPTPCKRAKSRTRSLRDKPVGLMRHRGTPCTTVIDFYYTKTAILYRRTLTPFLVSGLCVLYFPAAAAAKTFGSILNECANRPLHTHNTPTRPHTGMARKANRPASWGRIRNATLTGGCI